MHLIMLYGLPILTGLMFVVIILALKAISNEYH